MSTTANLHATLQAQAARRRESDQNAPRPARVRFCVNTLGTGESRMEGTKGITFNATMLEEPTFTWGVIVTSKVAINELPMCTAMVLRFKRNNAGLYTGADVAFRVDCYKDDVRLKFNLTFEASTLRAGTGGT